MSIYFKHLSPSHANDFIQRRPKWFAHRIMGAIFPADDNMHRGTAVEAGIAEAVFNDQNASMDQAHAAALSTFDRLVDGIESELRDSIPELVSAGINAMGDLIAEHGPVVAYQKRVECRLFHNGYPWLGLTDFTMADGATIDTKVSKVTKTAIDGGWGRAASYYWHGTGEKPVKFLALTPLKTKINANILPLDPELAPIYLGQLRDAERAIMTILENGVDKFAAAFMPDLEADFTWKTPEAREIARSIWR